MKSEGLKSTVVNLGRPSLTASSRTVPFFFSFNDYILSYTLADFVIIIQNTVILVHSVIKFLDRDFLFIEKVQAFLDLILSRGLARDKIWSKNTIFYITL